MNSKMLKELWTIKGNKGASNTIYKTNGFLGERCILAIANKQGEEIGCLFDNDMKGGKTVEECLRKFILNDGESPRMFYFDRRTVDKSDGFVPAIRTANNLGDISLQKLLNKLYHGITECKVTLIEHSAIQNYQGVKVYDFTKSNLKSIKYPKPDSINHKTQNGKNTTTYINIVPDGNFISIYYRRFDNKGIIGEPELIKRFFTEYSEELLRALNCLSGWALNGGALTVLINKTPVAFAEVVWLHRHNKLDMNEFENSLFEAHKELRANELLVDHMTHDKENNCLWALALVSDDVNKKLQERDKIKKPFFFWSVYCRSVRTLRIKCGKRNAWEKNFYFNVETDAAAIYTTEYLSVLNNYTALYKAFKLLVRNDCGNTDGSDTSYLTDYSGIEQMSDPGNPLLLMQNDFAEYVNLADVQDIEHAFCDVPKV